MSVTFNLPDLGEGLQEAEIVHWHVGEGQRVEVDQPLLSVETAKAGDTVQTGKPLVDFDLPSGQSPVTSHESPSGHQSPPSGQGMVVGHMATRNEEFVDHAIVGRSRRAICDRVRAAPAVRMLAKRLGVELSACKASGRHGLVSVDDVLAKAKKSATKVTAKTAAKKRKSAGKKR